MPELVIVGAGGFSKQIAELTEELNRERPLWRLLGFLDDDPALAETRVLGYPVLGPTAMAKSLEQAKIVIGVANVRHPQRRREIASRLALVAGRYASLSHPSASVSTRARIGEGSVALQNVVISHGAVLGMHALVSPGCVISHEARLGDGVTLASSVVVSGGCQIGAAAYLGAGCLIREGVIVGEGAVVGMGAVVIQNVPAGATVFGCPAREHSGAKRA